MSASWLAELPGEVRSFIARNAETFDQTVPWLEEFAAHIPDRGQVPELLRIDDGEPGIQEVLPVVRGDVALKPFGKCRALLSLSNYYTGVVAPIGRVAESGAVNRIARDLLSQTCDVDVVELAPIAADADWLARCVENFAAAGWHTQVYDKFGNWYLPVLHDSFEEYLRTRPGQLRSTVSRKDKKLRAAASVECRIVSDASEVDAALDRYESVYAKSWKVDEPHKDFIRAVCRRFASEGWLRLGLLDVDGSTAAAQIWFCYRGTTSIFKLAYDPAFNEYSAGTLLTARLMRGAIEQDKVSVVDFLSGDDAYKSDWMTHRRQRVGFRATRKASLAGVLEGAGRVVKGVQARLSGRA
jgi:hypothetical protein